MTKVRTFLMLGLLTLGSALLVGCCCDQEPNPCDPCATGAPAATAPAVAPSSGKS